MDTQTIDQEFEKLQTEFQDVAQTVQALATKMQAAAKEGDANATAWLADLGQVAHDIDDEQTQTKVLLLAVHSFIGDLAQSRAAPADATAGAEAPPLFAPGQDPFTADTGEGGGQQTEPRQHHHHSMLSGMMGGLMGGGMMGGGGGYYGGGFGQAMEMGMGMSLGADLVNSIFR
jgi:hypothetical protein